MRGCSGLPSSCNTSQYVVRMRCSSSPLQISASRPSAVIENSSAARARTFRNNPKANAAASNAGPRLAEVAGRTRSSRESAGARLLFLTILRKDGIETQLSADPTNLLQHLQHRTHTGVENDRSSLSRSQNILCLLLQCGTREQGPAMKVESKLRVL